MDKYLIAYFVGISIVFLTHLFMLGMPSMQGHALLNLFAGVCIAAYFVKTNGWKMGSYLNLN
jgi:hypothetical protein